MKHIFIPVLASIFVIGTAFAQTPASTSQEGINWIDIEEAQELNKKEPRKFIVDVYTDWCGWCKRMDATTFKNPVIVDYISKHYYAVKLNAETKDTINFKGKEYVNPNPTARKSTHQIAGIAAVNGKLGYPTIVYLDENLDIIQPISGFKTAKDIEPIIKFFGEDKYKTIQWPDYVKSFKSAL